MHCCSLSRTTAAGIWSPGCGACQASSTSIGRDACATAAAAGGLTTRAVIKRRAPSHSGRICPTRQVSAPRASVMVWFHALQNTFVLTLLLLEAGGNFSDEGRHVLFSATSSLMTFVLMVRRSALGLGSVACLHPGFSGGTYAWGPCTWPACIRAGNTAQAYRAHVGPQLCVWNASLVPGSECIMCCCPVPGHLGPVRPQRRRLRSHRCGLQTAADSVQCCPGAPSIPPAPSSAVHQHGQHNQICTVGPCHWLQPFTCRG